MGLISSWHGLSKELTSEQIVHEYSLADTKRNLW